MKVEFEMNDKEAAIIEDYMKRSNQNISDVARQAILEMIFNDDADLAAYEKAIKEYKENPTIYTHDEVWKALNKA